VKDILTILLCFISTLCYSQETAYLKIHFLYGSKPLKQYKDTEQKWFGGILGGHAGIEGDNDKVVSFLPSGKFHLIAKKDNRHSVFALHSVNNFYAVLGGNADSVKKVIINIPVTLQQKQRFDSITTAYLRQPPYDYALLGMRCGAAAYDILAQLEILPRYSYGKTYRKIFYPKKLRKRLFQQAATNNWTIERHDGSNKRKWEQD
jgi:hypothetical protein